MGLSWAIVIMREIVIIGSQTDRVWRHVPMVPAPSSLLQPAHDKGPGSTLAPGHYVQGPLFAQVCLLQGLSLPMGAPGPGTFVHQEECVAQWSSHSGEHSSLGALGLQSMHNRRQRRSTGTCTGHIHAEQKQRGPGVRKQIPVGRRD